jgi:hypothetical protein
MTGSDIEARIRVQKQRAADAEMRARSLEAAVAPRDRSGRFARAVTESHHNTLLSTLTRPKAGRARLIAALHRAPADD